MRDGFRRGVAAGDDGGLFLRLLNRRLRPFLLASPAGVGVVPVLPDAHLGGDDLQGAPHLFPDLPHGFPTDGTLQLFLTPPVLHYLDRHVLRKDFFQLAGTLRPGVRRHSRGLPAGRRYVRLRLVEGQAQLAHEFLMDLLAGRPEPPLLRKPQLLQQPLILAFQLHK